MKPSPLFAAVLLALLVSPPVSAQGTERPQQVLDEATGAFPGQPIRYPVEESPRHVPADRQQWLQTFTIDDGSLSR